MSPWELTSLHLPSLQGKDEGAGGMVHTHGYSEPGILGAKVIPARKTICLPNSQGVLIPAYCYLSREAVRHMEAFHVTFLGTQLRSVIDSRKIRSQSFSGPRLPHKDSWG